MLEGVQQVAVVTVVFLFLLGHYDLGYALPLPGVGGGVGDGETDRVGPVSHPGAEVSPPPLSSPPRKSTAAAATATAVTAAHRHAMRKRVAIFAKGKRSSSGKWTKVGGPGSVFS